MCFDSTNDNPQPPPDYVLILQLATQNSTVVVQRSDALATPEKLPPTTAHSLQLAGVKKKTAMY